MPLATSECVLRDLVTENADLQPRLHRELAEAQQQLREKVNDNKWNIYVLYTSLTAGGAARVQWKGEGNSPTTADEEGSRADEGRGDYQERETES